MNSWPIPPGLHPSRLLRLINRAIHECALDLDGAVVLTEAATGAYVVTPVIAALGGAAEVDAITRSSRHGSLDDVVRETEHLATLANVQDRIRIHTELTPDVVSKADVVTNSGHLRPLDARFIDWMRSDAVVSLMFESWELDLGRTDVDIAAMNAKGIRFAGTNERHRAIDVFSFLGPMANKLLLDASICAYRSRLLLLCDNPFESYLAEFLIRSGADVCVRSELASSDLVADLDAVVVALRPRDNDVLDAQQVALLARLAPHAVVVQFWGDVDRRACGDHQVPCVPQRAPARGHMGVLPSALGAEPVVRLQTGGLKVAAILRQPENRWTPEDREFIDAL